MAAGDGLPGLRAGLIDHHKLHAPGGSVFLVVAAVNGQVRPDGVFLPNLVPILAVVGIVHALAENGNQTASVGEPLEGLVDVPLCVAGLVVLGAPCGGGEGRIHQHQSGLDVVGQHIVQLLGVLIEHMVKAHALEDPKPALAQFVHGHLGPPALGKGGDAADSGGGFQHHLAGPHISGPGRQIGDVGRGGELLEVLLLLGAHRLGGQEPQKLLQLPDGLLRLEGIAVHILGEGKQILVHSQLQGIIGILAVVGPLALGPAKGPVCQSVELHGVNDPILAQILGQNGICQSFRGSIALHLLCSRGGFGVSLGSRGSRSRFLGSRSLGNPMLLVPFLGNRLCLLQHHICLTGCHVEGTPDQISDFGNVAAAVPRLLFGGPLEANALQDISYDFIGLAREGDIHRPALGAFDGKTVIGDGLRLLLGRFRLLGLGLWGLAEGLHLAGLTVGDFLTASPNAHDKSHELAGGRVDCLDDVILVVVIQSIPI